MKPRAFVFVASSAACLLSTGQASADTAFFYYGAEGEGSPFILPGVVTVGLVGGHIYGGIQIDSFHIYPKVGLEFFVGGPVGGFYASTALLAEYDIAPKLWAGLGAEVGYYQVHRSGDDTGYLEATYIYGGRLHTHWDAYHWITHDPATIGSFDTTITIGLDLRLIGRAPGFRSYGSYLGIPPPASSRSCRRSRSGFLSFATDRPSSSMPEVRRFGSSATYPRNKGRIARKIVSDLAEDPT